MTDTEIYEALYNGGNFSLPYLLKFTDQNNNVVTLVNNNEDVLFNNVTYKAASFEYTPPSNEGSGATLSISTQPNEDNELFEFVENANYKYSLQVVGVLINNTVQAIKSYMHYYGSVSYNEKGVVEFTLESDDRLDMTFPPYKYDTDNNRGNA